MAKKKKSDNPFPPEQTPRKEDLQMESGAAIDLHALIMGLHVLIMSLHALVAHVMIGEYFMLESERKLKQAEKKKEKSAENAAKKAHERSKVYVAPKVCSASFLTCCSSMVIAGAIEQGSPRRRWRRRGALQGEAREPCWCFLQVPRRPTHCRIASAQPRRRRPARTSCSSRRRRSTRATSECGGLWL